MSLSLAEAGVDRQASVNRAPEARAGFEWPGEGSFEMVKKKKNKKTPKGTHIAQTIEGTRLVTCVGGFSRLREGHTQTLWRRIKSVPGRSIHLKF